MSCTADLRMKIVLYPRRLSSLHTCTNSPELELLLYEKIDVGEDSGKQLHLAQLDRSLIEDLT